MVGDTSSRKMIAELKRRNWGRIFVDNVPKPYEGELWGFDNGAYKDFLMGRDFDGDKFIRRFERAYEADCHTPYLAVVPDLVGEGVKSLELSLSWREQLPDDWSWYLAVQDGMDLGDVEAILKEYQFAGIFLGGTNRFKKDANSWCQLAKELSLNFHFARCGLQRMDYAFQIGSNSLDTTVIMWETKRFGWVDVKLKRFQRQYALFVK